MARASSWIDREALGDLVAAAAWTPPIPARIAAPELPQRPSRSGPRFGSAPVPRTPQAQLSPEPSPPLRPRSVAPTASSPPPRPALAEHLPEYSPPRGRPIEGRLAHLLEWVTQTTGLREAMVADAEGLRVAAHNTQELQEAMCGVFNDLVQKLAPFVGGPIQGHLSLRVQGRSTLITWCTTVHGRFFLALLGDTQALRRPDRVSQVVGDLGAALRRALEEEGS